MRSSSELTVDEYIEPVFYCRNCHSLAIIKDDSIASDGWDGCYCNKCGSTNIGEKPFGDWLYEEEQKQKRRMEIEWNK